MLEFWNAKNSCSETLDFLQKFRNFQTIRIPVRNSIKETGPKENQPTESKIPKDRTRPAMLSCPSFQRTPTIYMYAILPFLSADTHHIYVGESKMVMLPSRGNFWGNSINWPINIYIWTYSSKPLSSTIAIHVAQSTGDSSNIISQTLCHLRCKRRR